MLARGICVSSSALVSPFIRSTVVAHVPKMFQGCFSFFFFNKHTSTCRGESRFGALAVVVRGVTVTCHLIQLYFNLQRLEESHSANDCVAEKRGCRREGAKISAADTY